MQYFCKSLIKCDNETLEMRGNSSRYTRYLLVLLGGLGVYRVTQSSILLAILVAVMAVLLFAPPRRHVRVSAKGGVVDVWHTGVLHGSEDWSVERASLFLRDGGTKGAWQLSELMAEAPGDTRYVMTIVDDIAANEARAFAGRIKDSTSSPKRKRKKRARGGPT